MRIAVYGTGGVGGYYGGRLAEAGEDVVFIARGEHLAALLDQGLRVDSTKGDFIVTPVEATDDPAAVGKVDVVMVCVKCWQVPEAAEAIRPMIGPDTYVLPMENGVEAPGQLAEILGWNHVLGGVCGIVSFKAGPGHIQHVAYEPFVNFGEWDNRRSDRVDRLYEAFSRAKGLIVAAPDDIQAAMWRKYILIASWSGIGAVTRAPIGAVRSVPGTRRLLERAMEEIHEVARAMNVLLPDDIVAITMATLDSVEYGGTASMQRDVMAGRLSELENQVGAIVRMGESTGVDTPVNSFIYNSLNPMEQQVRGDLSFEE
ncbi:MAG: 2-dehydropantoate 2-reductase [Candidatus Latescibacteria bacterium]|nr:2-dehydropantoate 2-reductase [Candidatus Latescibacterota bacterium]